MKVAALDLGSNTFLCLICDVKESKIETIYEDQVQIVKLGQGLSIANQFHPEALQRAKKALTDFSVLIKKHKPDKVLAMATSAARDAKNKDELFKICDDLNIPLEIISGNQEAEITYLGSVSGLNTENNAEKKLVIDIGGGSTEFIVGLGSKIITGHSQNIGCVRLTEKFIKSQPTSAEEINECTKYIYQIVQDSKNKLNQNIDQILAVAGTPTALVVAQLGYYSAEKIDGFKLTKENLLNWLDKLTNSSLQEKIEMGLPAGRAEVILIGVIILLVTLDVFNKKEIVVSTRGVRFGIALHM